MSDQPYGFVELIFAFAERGNLNMCTVYYAHIRRDEDTGEIFYQSVSEHLKGTAELCSGFAEDFGAKKEGELAGLAHDRGKCTAGFQNRLLHNGPRVDHASAGAIACAQMGALHTAACVIGHHSGLPDFGNIKDDREGGATLFGRLKKGITEKYLECCGDSGVTLSQMQEEPLWKSKLQQSWWTRMLYSCLVDADFLDTEQFIVGDRGRGGYDDIPTLLQRLQDYIAPWQHPKTELNRIRCTILGTCIEDASRPRGIYTLTVPTGGGKTVASLAFALHHAAVHGMRRVIYVIPYTSIIEQNAQVFRDILGEGNVLEDIHFSIRKGERIALIGKNGAGKSTMAKLFCGVIRPTEGEIYVSGQNYLSMTIRELGEKIGYVMQNPNQMIVKDMIKDEVGLGLALRGLSQEEIEERVNDALKMCNLYPMRNWPVSAVSYGQKKRVTIASILALKPQVMILDEPTAGQDYKVYSELMNFLDQLNKEYQITILFITHDMHLAIEYTDRAIVFSEGKCICDDTVYRVLANRDVIEKANLKQTSLYTLADRLGINEEEYIHHFITCEREERCHE